MSHIHLDKVENFIGFTLENAQAGTRVKVLTGASLISDQPEFYKFIEQISNILLSKAGVFIDSIYQFLVLIHKDSSANLYINDFLVRAEIRIKRDTKKGEIITQNDIADVKRLEFPNIKIKKSDKVIYCFKVGWKFGLFFDLDRQKDLDLDGMKLALGELLRYLKFQYIYEVLESKTQFEEMTKDGWFPFIEIIGEDYKKLTEFYQNKFDFDVKIKKFVNAFDKDRVKKLQRRWWRSKILKDKQSLIKAGIKAYLQDDESGFINCIKTLSSEIEGLIRLHYLDETRRGRNVSFSVLIQHVIEKGRSKSGSDYSLFLPVPFLEYLKDVFFANFDLEKGQINLSCHSSRHGVAKPEDYQKIKALQTILSLDQIYFYLS